MRRLLAAATDWRTLIWFGLGAVVAAVLSNPFPALTGLVVYVWAVQRLAASEEFKRMAEKVELAESLASKLATLQGTMREVFQGLPQSGERSWYARASDVVGHAKVIYQEYQARPDQQAEKRPLVEQALQLANLYLRILHAYRQLFVGRKTADLGPVRSRLERNQARLEATRDLEARRSLAQAIEMDERVLAQAADEAAEHERYQAKLAAIESTMDLLRRQLFDPETSAEGGRLHDMLLEAEAMDQALEEVQRHTRVRTR